ncbi:heterogeneous nuclear ribonucleoprotein U isoform X3 [Schistocerca gregaria]|uniref:heterogeneous nuclear ribonucleoprotein U isoform X3 n=1 Tax=Schistocerca gregaria TaxID=7010 RepID=UPI00211F185D|nr:heterogeneous nuclear ribonucleoprotein U isoform X3 [Schistocerca gregaria]
MYDIGKVIRQKKIQVAELKKELKARGLNTTGNKNELVERLITATGGVPGPAISGIDADVDAEDILGHDDEDDDVDSGGDEIAGDEEDAVLGREEEEEVLSGAGALPDVVGAGAVSGTQVTPAPAAASPAGGEQPQAAQKQDATPSSGTPRRIVLKRRPSTPPNAGGGAGAEAAAATSSTGGGVSTTTGGGGTAGAEDRPGSAVGSASKRVRITALGPAERMEIRKQKFGVVSDEAKKEIRALRFGIAPKTPDSDVLKKRAERFGITPETAPSSDVLKKRAERFGTTVSSALTKAELEEKMRKRRERFGTVTAEPVSGAAATTAEAKAADMTVAERKRLRALRFQSE